MANYTLPQYTWYWDGEIEISLPDEWQVDYFGLPGNQWPALSSDEIRAKIASPVGTTSLTQLATGKERVVILFDDISRPTPVDKLIAPVLDELHQAGIKDEQIQFICALGAHGAHSRIEFVYKLGEEVVRRYPVYNHNCYENNVVVGKTSRGTEVLVNAEYAAADLKIAIGAVLPHPFNGFGGGGKIITPGISAIDTIAGTHLGAAIAALEKGLNPVMGLGHWEASDMNQEVSEIAGLVGLDFAVQAIVSSDRKVLGVVAGEPVAAFRALAEPAKVAYGVPRTSDADLVIANASAKSSEATIALLFAAQALKPEGGDVVVVCHSPIGQLTHYLIGQFGRTIGGRFCARGRSAPANVKRVIIYSPYPSAADAEWFAPAERVIWATTWDEVMGLLSNYGAGSRVALYEDGTSMFFNN
ncbi:MAG: lactate racemase domain-containing protein [Methylocystaceae bacterium]